MCLVYKNSNTVLTNKRSCSSVTTWPSQYSSTTTKCNPGSSGPQRKKVCINKRGRKSVQFSPNVSLRCFFQHQPRDCADGIIPQEEINKVKSRAKALSKLHLQRSKINKSLSSISLVKTATIGDAVRYEIKGESLRGMEYITVPANGRKRRWVQEKAMQAVAIEQQEQLVQHVLDSRTVNQAKNQAMKIDTSKLAKVYGPKTRGALRYAKQIAEEDAKIAAAILAEDLQPQQEGPSLTRCSAVNKINIKISTHPSVAANLIRSNNIKFFCPSTSFRHQNTMASMQA